MGDVISITDTNDTEIVQYEYDAWGKCVSTLTTNDNDIEVKLANINPIRYRGYYLDNETGYYYLQSRYYDPDICRFINADSYEMAQACKDILCGLNTFSYCNDDPLNKIDPTGHISTIIACVLVGAAIGLLVDSASGAVISYVKFKKVNWKYVVVGGVFGIAVGALSGYCYGVMIGATSATTSFGMASQAKYLAKNVTSLKYSQSIKKYIGVRSYYKYYSVIKAIINSAIPIKDGLALKWVVPGTMNGTKGVWELVINPMSKVIYHYLFKS